MKKALHSIFLKRFLLHIPFVVLFVMAVTLYQERLFVDSGYYIFRVINGGFFWIEHDRLVLAFSQILPLCALWLNAGLKTILIGYSIGHVLYFYLLFFIALFLLKDMWAALGIILIQVLGIIFTFFTPQFELYYGAGLLFLFYSFLSKRVIHKWNIVLLVVLEVLILTSHPMNFMLLLFVLCFDFVTNDNKYQKHYTFLLLILLAGIIFKFLTLSEYEHGKIFFHLNFTKNRQYLNLLNMAYLVELIRFLVSYYIDVVVLLIINILFYFKAREYGKLMLLSAFSMGYIVLINITYDAVEPGRYIEQLYFPLVIIVILPFLYDVFRRMSHKFFPAILLTVIVIYRLFLIIDHSIPFQQRALQITRLTAHCQQLDGSKFMFKEKNIRRSYSMLNWSYPIETILLSALEGKEKAVTLINEKDFRYCSDNKSLTKEYFIFRSKEIYPDSYLNASYFNLAPAVYRPLNQDSIIPGTLDDFMKNIEIEIKISPTYNADQQIFIPVTITNNNPGPLFSGRANKIFVSYHWYGIGYMYEWDGIRTPLEVDIIRSYSQDIIVKTPEVKGDYWLSVDIISEEKSWFGIEEKREVSIK